jgi:hypothetical protein
MKSFLRTLVGAGVVLSAGALAQTNGGAEYPLDVPIGSLKFNIADVLCTAALNSNGSTAGGETVAGSTRLGVGTYQVTFKKPCQNITAKNGWARMVHPDTHTFGSLPSVNCTTADRAGVPNAIWVACYNAAGAPADTSFGLFVLR